MTTVLHGLLIESDASVPALFEHHLTEAGYDVIRQRCASAADLQVALANPTWKNRYCPCSNANIAANGRFANSA